MPVCRKCEKKFAIKIYIDGKQHNLCNRKYCLDCSPFGAHNTRKVEIPFVRKVQRKTKKTCKVCQRNVLIGNCGSVCATCKGSVRRNLHSTRAREMLGDKCFVCGYDKCKKALQFHHLDPNNKEFNLSANWHWSWQRLEKEILKCRLLCSRCHTEVHEGLAML